ncbi:Protein CDV3 homolog [Eumeta japonica]|uniref:Protein CDV3 homolog n=1 Tax=Eumeta variegata TaxID=151549 RepID=A0A4C1VDM3_EUMVA|nr:Protein CDV3 homolog [Eumeta japonica]
MADLDDFFAKKDRKKKSVKKFATADELAKKLEDTKQKPDVRPKKERPAQEGEEGARGHDEEEWKEYEEPVKDYTGLKIQVLQGGAEGSGGGGGQADSASEDGSADGSSRPKGPWNKPQPQSAPAPEPEPVVVAPPPEPNPPKTGVYMPPKSTAYVAPGLRSRPVEPPTRRNQPKLAPDIHNDDYFPVLGAAPVAKKPAGWSTAGAAGRAPAPTASRQQLALGNRFTALNDDS